MTNNQFKAIYRIHVTCCVENMCCYQGTLRILLQMCYLEIYRI